MLNLGSAIPVPQNAYKYEKVTWTPMSNFPAYKTSCSKKNPRQLPSNKETGPSLSNPDFFPSYYPGYLPSYPKYSPVREKVKTHESFDTVSASRPWGSKIVATHPMREQQLEPGDFRPTYYPNFYSSRVPCYPAYPPVYQPPPVYMSSPNTIKKEDDKSMMKGILSLILLLVLLLAFAFMTKK